MLMLPDSWRLRTRSQFVAACRVLAPALLAGVTVAFIGCNGGGGASNGAILAETSTMPTEQGPASKIVRVAGAPNAVVALFPDGRAYFSPDGFNVGGGGATVAAYSGPLAVADVQPVGSGVEALLSDGSAYFSPDGKNLGGGGATAHAYSGAQGLQGITAVGSGIDATFANGAAYYSPDGMNLGGGGQSVAISAAGTDIVSKIIPLAGAAVLTWFADGSATYSPDNRNLAGGGATTSVAADGEVQNAVPVVSGVLAALNDGQVHLSDGAHQLAAGVVVASWSSVGDLPFPARDSAHGAAFAGHLWVSGGFADPDNDNDCFATCSFFDLWGSVDAAGQNWFSAPTFATATQPDPRDADATTKNGVQDPPPPTDFYDAYSALAIWNNQLTAVGATVWRSSDGVAWARNNLADGVTAAPGPVPIRATENTRAVVLGTALFLLQPDSGEVYRSTDQNAAAWTDLGAIPGFTPRCGATVFVLQNKIWLEGGGACDYTQVYHDIWSSADGVTWTHSATPAAWHERMWPCVAAGPDGLVWLATGYWPSDWNNTSGTPVVRYGANHADLWYTRDGTNWRQLKADFGSGLVDAAVLVARHAPTCFVTGDAATGTNLLIAAGSGGPDPNGFNARVLNNLTTLSLPPATALP